VGLKWGVAGFKVGQAEIELTLATDGLTNASSEGLAAGMYPNALSRPPLPFGATAVADGGTAVAASLPSCPAVVGGGTAVAPFWPVVATAASAGVTGGPAVAVGVPAVAGRGSASVCGSLTGEEQVVLASGAEVRVSSCGASSPAWGCTPSLQREIVSVVLAAQMGSVMWPEPWGSTSPTLPSTQASIQHLNQHTT